LAKSNVTNENKKNGKQRTRPIRQKKTGQRRDKGGEKTHVKRGPSKTQLLQPENVKGLLKSPRFEKGVGKVSRGGKGGEKRIVGVSFTKSGRVCIQRSWGGWSIGMS